MGFNLRIIHIFTSISLGWSDWIEKWVIALNRLYLRCVLIFIIILYQITLRCLVKVRLVFPYRFNHWVIDWEWFICARFTLRKQSSIIFNRLNLRLIHFLWSLSLPRCLTEVRYIFFSRWFNHWILNFFGSFYWGNCPEDSFVLFIRLKLTYSLRLLPSTHPTDFVWFLLIERLILVSDWVQGKRIHSFWLFCRHIKSAASYFLIYLSLCRLIVGDGTSNNTRSGSSLLYSWSWWSNWWWCRRWLGLSLLNIISLDWLSHLAISRSIVFYLGLYFDLLVNLRSHFDWFINRDRLWNFLLWQWFLRFKWIRYLHRSIIPLYLSRVFMLISVFKLRWNFCNRWSLSLFRSWIGLLSKTLLRLFPWFNSNLHIHISHLWFPHICLNSFIIHRDLRGISICKLRWSSRILSGTWRVIRSLVGTVHFPIIHPLLESIVHFLQELFPQLVKLLTFLREHIVILAHLVLHIKELLLSHVILIQEPLALLHHSHSFIFKKHLLLV